MATAPSPNDLTRQQLDELDALLQRMLSVPLAPTDTPMPSDRSALDDAPPLPPSWRIDPPAPAVSASLPHLLLAEPPSAAKLEPPAPPPAPKPQPAAPPAPKPVLAAPPAPLSPAPAPKPVPAPALAIALQQAASVAAPAITPAPSAPPVALPLLPLVALNALFDAGCGLFGPLGRVLRSGFFKHLYGLAGLGLLAYTAAHIAQVQGWITLPVPLPWPQSWPR